MNCRWLHPRVIFPSSCNRDVTSSRFRVMRPASIACSLQAILFIVRVTYRGGKLPRPAQARFQRRFQAVGSEPYAQYLHAKAACILSTTAISIFTSMAGITGSHPSSRRVAQDGPPRTEYLRIYLYLNRSTPRSGENGTLSAHPICIIHLAPTPHDRTTTPRGMGSSVALFDRWYGLTSLSLRIFFNHVQSCEGPVAFGYDLVTHPTGNLYDQQPRREEVD